MINQNFKDVLRMFLRLRVDKERFYFAHLYINDKHKIKVTKNLNQPLLKTSAFHKLLEIFLKAAQNSSKNYLKKSKVAKTFIVTKTTFDFFSAQFFLAT